MTDKTPEEIEFLMKMRRAADAMGVPTIILIQNEELGPVSEEQAHKWYHDMLESAAEGDGAIRILPEHANYLAVLLQSTSIELLRRDAKEAAERVMVVLGRLAEGTLEHTPEPRPVFQRVKGDKILYMTKECIRLGTFPSNTSWGSDPGEAHVFCCATHAEEYLAELPKKLRSQTVVHDLAAVE